MKDLLPEWIADYENFQLMPLELSADIDRFLRLRPMNKDVEEMREFLSERFNILQAKIDELKVASASGTKVLLMNEDEQAGWDARIEAEELEKRAQ